MLRHAMVLTAGLGTRLRPLSDDRAKPAMPVAGVPLIRRIVRWLTAQGISDIILNLHYKPETIVQVVGDGSDLGARVRYSWEPRILGSAGGPRLALPLLDTEYFALVNGDTLSEVDLQAMADAHLASRAQVTMAVTAPEAEGRYGGVLANEAGEVSGFSPRGTTVAGAWHFVGVQIVTAGVFDPVPLNTRCDTVNELYRDLLNERRRTIRVFPTPGPFYDVGTPADYLRTSLTFAKRGDATAALRGRNARIHPSAQLTRTVIWDEVTVEAGVALTECVVGDRVVVPVGARFERQAIVRRGEDLTLPAGHVEGDLLVVPLDVAR